MPPVAPSGPNFSVRGPEAKRAMGRGENNPAVNVLAYALQIHQSAIVRGEKNRVGQTLMNLVNDFPDPDFWTIDTPTEKRVINPSTGLVTTQEDPLFANRDDVVHIKVDGVGVILHLKHAPLAKSMFLQLDDACGVADDGVTLVTIHGRPIKPEREYSVGLLFTSLTGMDNIEPLLAWGECNREKVPPEDSGIPVKVLGACEID